MEEIQRMVMALIKRFGFGGAWTIARMVRWGSGVILAVLLVGGVFASVEINEIRMGGPIQTRSAQAADLIADILPPPEYVIEPYLEATLLAQDPSTAASAAASFKRLKADYDARRTYWTNSDLKPELKQLLDATHGDADTLWQEIETGLLPAAQRGDSEAVKASYAAITAAYAEHRKRIDTLVEAATEYQTEIRADGSSTLARVSMWLGALAIVIVGAMIGSTLLLLRRVVKPLQEVTDATTALAAGEQRAVPHLGRTDELGEIAHAVERFRVAAVERSEKDALAAREQANVTNALGERLGAIRDGDLTKFLQEEFPPAYEVLRENFNVAVNALRDMIQRVNESARDIDTSSTEIAAASEDLARRTEADAATLAQTRAAIEQIDARLRASMENALETVARAEEADAAIASGRGSASNAVQAMDRVNESANDIGSVIEGLDKIAFQTRVLSMNATVEAGRAGEAGRGFAVVADLVSALAQRAEVEAARARDLITVTQSQVVGAVASVRETDGALESIATRVGDVRQRLDTMRQDNVAQSAAVAEVSQAAGALDSAVQRNAAMVEETSAAARNLSNEVGSLAQRAAAFKFERRVRNVPVAVDRRAGGRRGSAADQRGSAADRRPEGVRVSTPGHA